MSVQPDVPVGSVSLYAGDLSVTANQVALVALGWLPCDGSSYAATEYPDLYAVIGDSHGGGGTNFNVPQLADRFVRGVTGSSAADPDAANRTAAAPGGATGNAVGSVQAGSTALPQTPWVFDADKDHAHNYWHLCGDSHEAWGGHSYTDGRWPGGATSDSSGSHVHGVTGGDTATVPVSLALCWIIRATASTAGGTVPAGGILGMGGSGVPAAGWLACDGMAQAISAVNADLASTIGFNYGGDGESVFDLPDFRGRFLRGTDHGRGRDPDAATRGESQTGGATGDAVGSLQGFATANGQIPFVTTTAGAHTHAMAQVPVNDHHVAWGAIGPGAWNVQEWTGDSTATSAAGSHSHTVIGGDDETRPENVYLNWLVAQADIAAAPPIGSIIPYVGDVTNMSNYADLVTDGWYPCTGGKLKLSDPNGKALYDVIGNTFGVDRLSYYLPDLCGRFVVGVGTNPIGTVLANSTTGSPVTPFSTTSPGDHTHAVPTGIPTDTQGIDVVAGCDTAEHNDASVASDSQNDHKHKISGGGDAESRPVNVNVDFIIRFR